MRPKNPTVGEQELELLAAIREKGPISAGDMAKTFGEPRGLARTTVLTMMERLRKKGYLARSEESGVFRYSLKSGAEDTMKGLVGDFVNRTLGGSLAPFVSYVVDSGKLSPEEIESLRKIVESFDAEDAK